MIKGFAAGIGNDLPGKLFVLGNETQVELQLVSNEQFSEQREGKSSSTSNADHQSINAV